MVQEMIQNILVYVMMTTILKGLVSNKGFLEIFRFVSGLILILLFAGPVFSVFSKADNWYHRLEENILDVDYNQMEQEMAVAQGRFEEILQEELHKQLKQQIKDLIKEEGLLAERIEVDTIQKEGETRIKEIQVEVTKKSKKEELVEEVEIDLENEQMESRKVDKETKLLQEKICEKFELKEGAVKVWKINGGNG